MGFGGLERVIIDSCHVWFDGWLIGCHAALIWSLPICIRKSLPTMCCRPLTSRLNHFERPSVLLLCLSPTLSPSLPVWWSTDSQKSERRGNKVISPWNMTHRHIRTHTLTTEHHTTVFTSDLFTPKTYSRCDTHTQTHTESVEEAGGVG